MTNGQDTECTISRNDHDCLANHIIDLKHNNSFEGWHATFKKRLNIMHPTLPKLLRIYNKKGTSYKLVFIKQAFMRIEISKEKRKKNVITLTIELIYLQFLLK